MDEDRLEAIQALDDAAERAEVNITKGIQRLRHPEPERLIVEELEAAGWRLVKAAVLAAVTEDLAAICDSYGLPHDIDGLHRHLVNGRAASEAFLHLAVDGWKERAEKAEAALAAVTEERDALVEALKQASGIAHRSQHDHNTPMWECRSGGHPGTGTRCGEWAALLAPHRSLR